MYSACTRLQQWLVLHQRRSAPSEEFTMHRTLVHARIPICMPTLQQSGTAAMACPAPEATCVLIGIQDALHAAYSCSGALMSALRRRLWAACPGPRHWLVRRHRRSASSEEFITHGYLVPAWNPVCQTMQLQQRPAAMACPEPEEVCALKRISGRQARCMPLRLRFGVHLETSAWRRWS